MDDRQAVLAANAEFYRAFENLDLSEMEAVWMKAPQVKCVHPGWSLLVGFGPVMDSWQRIFANTRGMHFELVNVLVDVVGDLAWVVLTEVIETRTADGADRSLVQATNIFQRHYERWLLVHHQGSPVYMPPGAVGPQRMH
ncbi:MAG: nuclear transport factor 2 family protein [Deltaproteobacteria bacterium]|nr:nuclear transport factor 2 family protein [Deltaproteobacteria bacterium]